jgi:preprotein translocase subunit SecA
MAVMEELTKEHETGRPVLVVTESIGISELVSGLLLEDGIPHSVLNAHNAAKEAQIIKEAGQKGAVTVATGMAGRGTDIKLGEGADALGGLSVLIVGEMENRRTELQARGRAGRQGDPGSSRVFVSLDDTVIRDHGKKSLRKYRTTDRAISAPRLVDACRQAQKVSEEQGRLARRSTAEYAVSLSRQRQLVYGMRDKILKKVPEDDAYYLAMERDAVDAWLEKTPGLPGVDAVARYCLDNITYRLPAAFDRWDFSTRDRIRDVVLDLAREAFARQKQAIGKEEYFALFLRRMLLRALDDAWVEQVDYLQQLRSAVAGRQYAQKNVIYEYHQEAFSAFVRMEGTVKAQAMRCILLGEVVHTETGGIQVRMP